MKEAVIVSSVRTAIGRAKKGSLALARPENMAATAIREAMKRAPGLDGAEVDDVIMGCSFPEAEQGLNVARACALLAGLPDTVAGMTVNRFCSSGLQTIALAAQSIMSGMAEVVVAGGVESMSRVPMTGVKPMANPEVIEKFPDLYLNMGLTAENVADKYGISRDEQDAFAAESHRRAFDAIENGRFKEEIVPFEVTRSAPAANGKTTSKTFTFDTDEGPRTGTTAEGLGKLRPAFKVGGSVTAGNSSQMSDGASAAVVMSADRAKALGLKPMARFVSFAQGGVDPAFMGIGPVVAIPKALKIAGLTVSDIDLVELNEAFASQALYSMRELGLDASIVNVNGGAIALGHPLGCTGAKLTATLLHEMKRRGSRYGIVSMCIGGGMGAAGIYENLS
jgi:acetyl-CoA acyltransferase